MKDHLQKIRDEHPDLNPTETYDLLSKVILPDELEHLFNALEEYDSRLEEQLQLLREKKPARSADALLERAAGEWFEAVKDGQQSLSSISTIIQDVVRGIPGKIRIAEMVDETIRTDYPQFHQEYLEHQQWLKVNEERLARQEQQQLQSEQARTHNPDGHTR